MNTKSSVASPMAAELASINSESSPMPMEVPAAQGAWTRDIEALCRALRAQERAHFPSIDAEKE